MERKALNRFFTLALFGIWATVLLAACPAQASFLPMLVQDINPGSAGSGPSQLTAVNGTLFFVAYEGSSGFELWKSGVTLGTTSMVKDITPGPASSEIYGLRNVNGTLFFVLYKEGEGCELWKSDGTEEGTVKAAGPFEWLGNLGMGIPLTRNPILQSVGNTVYFFAKDSTVYGLWKHDSTMGTTGLLKGDLMVYQLGVERNGILFFSADDTSIGSTLQPGILWRTDGTIEGTHPVGGDNFFSWIVPGIDPGGMAVMNDSLFLSADNSFGGGGGAYQELWRVDGSETSSLVYDIFPGYGGSEPKQLTPVGNTLFFTADDGATGKELWACKWQPPNNSGQPYYVSLVKDIVSGAESSDPQELTAVNGTLFFTAEFNYSRYLYKSDGTLDGTVGVKNIEPPPADVTGPYLNHLTGSNGKLFFAANDGVHGWELWVSNGNEEGTGMAVDVNPGGAHSRPSNLTDVNGTLFFVAENGTYGRELWKLVEIDQPDPREWILANLFEKKYYKKGDIGLRNALVSIMGEVNLLMSQGNIPEAVRKLQNVRRHVDGSGQNDWVIDRTAQRNVTGMIDGLIAELNRIR